MEWGPVHEETFGVAWILSSEPLIKARKGLGGGLGLQGEIMNSALEPAGWEQLIYGEREVPCFAGSVPATLPLNIPLIGLEIHANPRVEP